MNKIEIVQIRKELCDIFNTPLFSGTEVVASLMSSTRIHDLNSRFGLARRKLEAGGVNINFDFSEKVISTMKERVYCKKTTDPKAYSLYETVYGLVRLLDCFLQLGELGENNE